MAITASTGDGGYGLLYPASSRLTTAVGGTSLVAAPGTSRGWTETAWAGSGSGCSSIEAQPAFQWDVLTGCPKRADADVAAVADPNTGVAVYQTYGYTGWTVYGGTSVAAPIIAGVWALAGPPVSTDTPNYYPYASPGHLYDITSGSNGSCGTSPLCNAGRGWDGPTGLGTPNGVLAFQAAHALFLQNPGSQVTAPGITVHLRLVAWDSVPGTSLTYYGTMPPGVTVNFATGLITGSDAYCGSTDYTYSATATVADNVGAVSTTFNWTMAHC